MNAEFQTGDVLLGKYRVDGIVGQGGMGFIVRAQHLQLGECVALKFLRREILESPEAVHRFMREARAAIRIKSEHVARVIDVNTLETGEPFIVMEYLDGESLGNWAVRHGPLPIQTVVEFTLQICEAIAEAHGLGIVHRDLKPANVYVTRRADGILAAKVLDFGISKVSDPVSATAPTDKITKDVAMGSPAYCSPEQLQTPQDVDLRADLWSLGVVLYELLAGSLPFSAEHTLQLCVNVIHEDFEPLKIRRPELPEELCQVVERCLKKKRDARFNNVGELALALAPFAPPRARPSVERIIRTVTAAGGSFPEHVPLESPSSEQTNAPHVLDRVDSTRLPQPGSRAMLVVSALIALAGLGGFAAAKRLGPPAQAEGTKVFVIENSVATGSASGPSRTKSSSESKVSSPIAVQLPVTSEEPKPEPSATRTLNTQKRNGSSSQKARTQRGAQENEPTTVPAAADDDVYKNRR